MYFDASNDSTLLHRNCIQLGVRFGMDLDCAFPLWVKSSCDVTMTRKKRLPLQEIDFEFYSKFFNKRFKYLMYEFRRDKFLQPYLDNPQEARESRLCHHGM